MSNKCQVVCKSLSDDTANLCCIDFETSYYIEAYVRLKQAAGPGEKHML